MPTTRRALARPLVDAKSSERLRITNGALEITTATPAELSTLRRLMSQVNGASSPQPYLVEIHEGRFRLYIGPAAERARTAQGIVGNPVGDAGTEEAEREGFEPSVEL
jgi:hypothetical protein